jgi:hypothetical protein
VNTNVKRAGFMWGIGRELYEWKDIWVELNDNETYDYKGKKKVSPYMTKNLYIKEISYQENGLPENLIIVDNKGNVRYEYKNRFNTIKANHKPKNNVKKEIKQENNDDSYSEEQIANDVANQNNEIFKFLVFEAHKIIDNKKLATELTKEYFKDVIKIPLKKMELTREEQTKSLPNLVVVKIDDDWLLEFRNYMSNKIDKKEELF